MLSGFLWVTEESEKQQCFSIRQEVFVKEQGFELEFDEIDDVAYHLLFLDDEKPVATARLFLCDWEWHIGRVCVLKAYRNKGIGKFLVKECINKAKELKKSTVIGLSAQTSAQAFYQKLGFSPTGDIFYDETCPHIQMKMTL